METIITYALVADDNTIFAATAFDSWVGQEVPWLLRETDDHPGREIGTAVVKAVRVSGDGKTAVVVAALVRDVVTLTLPEPDLPVPMSFAPITDHGPSWDDPMTGDRTGDRSITADHSPGSQPDHTGEGE